MPVVDLRSALSSLLLAVSATLAQTPGNVGTEAAPPLIPREVFFGDAERTDVAISPDGAWLSYLAPVDGVMNIWVQDLSDTSSEQARPVTRAAESRIRDYSWAHNNRQVIYSQDSDGNESHHLFAVDIHGGEPINLTPIDGIQARLIATSARFPNEILVAINARDTRFHDVWRVDARTGARDLIFENDRFVQVIADDQLNVRLGVMMTDDGGQRILMRDAVDQPWYDLIRWSMEDAMTSGPLGFSRSGKTTYLLDTRNRDTAALHAYTTWGTDVSTYTTLAVSDDADITRVAFHPATGRAQAAAHEYTRLQWQLLDSGIARDLEYLSLLRDGDLHILSRDQSDRTWIVSYSSDQGSTAYYLYDRPNLKARHLFSDRPSIESLSLQPMQSVVVTARDGLRLVAYLTEPARQAAGKTPMVLLVHGGPWARDHWGFNPIHQWLANRGYAVLSVNFRGSTGLGKRHLNAGNREWAAAMHDDLIDAVNWAVAQGIADPDRVAIMGGSYGGYATLVGLAFTPEFFAAGVDIVGPSDVRTLLENLPQYWVPLRAMFKARVGSPDEPGFLERISPINRVDAIRRPLLIAQGANDSRVPEAQSRAFAQAMAKKGLPVTYAIFPDEGHGLARPINRQAFYALTEVFLAEHLGGRFELLGATIQASSVQIPIGAEHIPGLQANQASQKSTSGEAE